MFRIALVIALLLPVSATFAQDAAQQPADKITWLTLDQAMVQWQQDMKAYQDEPDEKKKVPPKKFFIDVYTSWCGWCKRMDATIFADPVIAKVMNEHFYAIKLDAEMKTPVVWDGHTFVNPNPDGKRSTHQFAASLLDNRLSYPSYALLDENAKRIALYKGFKQANDFLGIMLFFGKNQYLAYRDYVEKYAPKQ